MPRTPHTSTAVRRGAAGALLAATVLLFSAAVAFLSPYEGTGPEGSIWWLLIASSETLLGVGAFAALLGLHVLQGPRAGRVGAAGTWVAGTGSALFVVVGVVWLLPVTEGVLLDVLFWAAVLGWAVGFPLVGAGALRARMLPRWIAAVLAGYPLIFAAVFVLVESYGEARALLALPWLAVAYGFASARPAAEPAAQDAEVRA